MDLGLRGKSALVTGGSLGIGFAIAEGLAQAGCNLHLASRSAENLRDARQRITERYGVSVSCHALDLSLPQAADRLSSDCRDIDVLINNAGAIPWGSILDMDAERWQRSWDLKVFGYIRMTRAFYRRMCERGRGVIINIVGTAGERPSASHIAGSMANAALMALCYALGSESAQHGVRVLGVNPGPVETERQVARLKERATLELKDAARWRELTARFPFGRLATPDEVAKLVVFLVSDCASYMSGTVVTIDGGASRRT